MSTKTKDETDSYDDEATRQQKEGYGDFTDVIVGTIIALLLYWGLYWFATYYECGRYKPLLILLGIVGGSIGWVIGILASPYNRKENSSLSQLSKLAYGFLTGYVFSKADPIVNKAFRITDPGQLSKDHIVFALFTISSFMIAVAVTYISRSYWVDRR